MTLPSAETINQGLGVITAGILTGSSGGATSLTDANLISGLGAFTTGGALTLNNTVALTQTPGTTVNAGAGTILIDNGGAAFTQSGTLTTANASAAAIMIQNTGPLSVGTISVGTGGTVVLGTPAAPVGPATETGTITAAVLTGNAVGGAALTGAKQIGTFGPFNNASSGLLSFTDAQPLTTAGTIISAGGVALTTTSGNLTLNGDVTSGGQTVALNSAGTLDQNSGIITAGTLTGGSTGNATFGQNNAIDNLGAFVTGNGNLSLNDGTALNINGAVNAGTGNVGLTVVGPITEQGAGAILAAMLTTQSTGGANLNGQNSIGNLAASTNTGSGGFALNDVAALTVGGAVDAGTADLTLTSLGKLTVNAGLTAARNVNLTGGGLLLAAAASAGQDASLTSSNGDLTLTATAFAGRDLKLAASHGNTTVTTNQTAGGDLLGTADGLMNLTGSFKLSAGKNLVLVSNGAFTQRGTLTVGSPDIVIDTTGRTGGASQLLTDLLAAQGGGTSIANASIIKAPQFRPSGGTQNAISFDTGTINTNSSVMLLLGDAGTMTGTVNLGGLGVSGLGGSADLHGSIAGSTTQTAALRASSTRSRRTITSSTAAPSPRRAASCPRRCRSSRRRSARSTSWWRGRRRGTSTRR